MIARNALLLLFASLGTALPQTQVIKMGTAAPQGSPWHAAFQQMGADWRTASQGKVKLDIIPGLGDESDIITKMRIGAIQAAAVSSEGLRKIDPAAGCFQIPMMIDSYEELDYVRDRIAPVLEKRLEAKGYVVLNWGDAGWVHFFTKRPATRLSDIRKMKLFVWAGDEDELELAKAAGFNVVPLAATDILMALQTGLIDSFDTAPLLALSNQWFGLAKNMIAVKWAPLIGAAVISKATWERIPEGQRAEMLKAARQAGERMRGDIRKFGDDAVAAMQKRGLNVLQPDAAALDDWRREGESICPRLRGRTVPADMFDEVMRLRNEFRANHAAAKTGS